MLGESRNDNRPELTALRFVNGYGVGQIQFRDVVTFIVNRPPSGKNETNKSVPRCRFP